MTERLPETPFSGTVVSVDRASCGGDKADVVNLAIRRDDDSGTPPLVVYHSFSVSVYTEPRMHLRESHKVRVKKVGFMNNGTYVQALQIDFDGAQLGDHMINKGSGC